MGIAAVIDANVIVSAFIQPKGPSAEVLQRFLINDNYRLVLSHPILAEIRRTLAHQRLQRFLKRTPKEIERQIFSMEVIADFIEEEAELPSQDICRDPGDLIYLAAAVQGKADYIVSGDKDLLVLKEYEGVKIVRPVDFLKIEI